jgi:uncharacterized protein YjbI with pentapeptide repeats
MEINLKKRQNINFEELILLYKSLLDDINKNIEDYFSHFSNRDKTLYQFMGVTVKNTGYLKFLDEEPPYLGYYINYKDTYSEQKSYVCYRKVYNNFYFTNDKENSSKDCFARTIVFYEIVIKGFSYEVVINEIPFFVRLDIITNCNCNFNSLNNTYATIKICNKKTNKIEEFQYNYNERTIYKKVGDKTLILPEEIKNQVINKFPVIHYKTLPKELVRYIKSKRYIIELTPKKEDDISKANQSFIEAICGNNFTNETSNIDNKESIKIILTKMKESQIELNPSQKVKISNNLFYTEITNTKKTIDPFFNDEEILKYCDLSKIDFTNADIRNFNLANTNASIIISKVYNRDITNANLENINLSFQDLSGIKADYANLKGTFVTVSIDRASIVETKFDKSCSFFLGKYRLNETELAAMGIDIDENTSAKPLMLQLQ